MANQSELMLFLIFLSVHCNHVKRELPEAWYFHFSNCASDDRQLAIFSSSITPFPSVFIPKDMDMTMWFGGQLYTSESAQQVVGNKTFAQFVDHLTAVFYVDRPRNSEMEQVISSYQQLNNSLLCDNGKEIRMMNEAICQALFEVLRDRKQNVSAFIPIHVHKKSDPHNWWPILLDLQRAAPVQFQGRFKFNLFHDTLLCINFTYTLKSDLGQSTPGFNDFRYSNFANSFLTPKVDNIYDSKSPTCPPGSFNDDHGICKCPGTRSGPYCALQCNLDQIKLLNNCVEGTDKCGFAPGDYADLCLSRHNISILSESMNASAINLHRIHISWKMTNYFTFVSYPIEIIVRRKDDREVGVFQGFSSHYEGMANHLNLTHLSYRGKEISINLKSFSNYTVTLNLKTKNHNDDDFPREVDTVTFETYEAKPSEAKIISAEINKMQLSVSWRLIDSHCPGYIRFNEAQIGCMNIIKQVQASFPQAWDCRNIADYPKLEFEIPEKCSNENLAVKIRVATAIGFGSWSEIAKATPVFEKISILALILGVALVLAVIVVPLGIWYYYMRHVQPLQGVYDTIVKLLQINQPPHVLAPESNSNSISLGRPRAPQIALPARPTQCHMCCDTVFEHSPEAGSAASPADTKPASPNLTHLGRANESRRAVLINTDPYGYQLFPLSKIREIIYFLTSTDRNAR